MKYRRMEKVELIRNQEEQRVRVRRNLEKEKVDPSILSLAHPIPNFPFSKTKPAAGRQHEYFFF